MEHKIFSTKHSMVEIVKPNGNGTMSETWCWEVTIAVNETTYKGKAVEASRGAVIKWAELTSMDPLSEMIEHCKAHMER